MIDDRLMGHLCLMARTLPPTAVGQICAAIRGGALQDGSLPDVAVTSETRGLLEQLLEDWAAASSNPSEVAAALQAANEAVNDERSERSVEVVWTGPESETVPVRRVDQVLYQLIQGAHHRLLLVSYAVYGVRLVLQAVNEAAGRGVHVDVVLEFEGHDGMQEWDPLKALGDLDERVRVFEWPLDKRKPMPNGQRGMIHAKCAVADSRVALIGSANLTEYAFDANMEMGLLVEGQAIASQIEQHFRDLMDRGELQRRLRR